MEGGQPFGPAASPRRAAPPRQPSCPPHTHPRRRAGWRAACAEESAKTWRPYRVFNLSTTVPGDPVLQAARRRDAVDIISEATAALATGGRPAEMSARVEPGIVGDPAAAMARMAAARSAAAAPVPAAPVPVTPTPIAAPAAATAPAAAAAVPAGGR